MDADGQTLLRADEVARRLGVSRATAYKMMHDGELPVVRIGKAVRVSSFQLTAWIEGRTQEPKNLGP